MPARLRMVVALTALAVLGAACSEGPELPSGAEGPTPTPTPTPTPEEPGPGPADDEDIAATFDEIVEQVAELRGLEPTEEIPVEVLDRDELVAQAIDTSDEALERLERTETVLAALHHIPADADLDALIEEIVTVAAIGLYDHEEGRAYLVGDGKALTPSERTVVAHEVVHALQDQHFDLGRLDDLADDPDAALAFRSIAEGDAVLIQEQWAATHLSEEEQQQRQAEELQAGAEQQEALQGLPTALVESFIAPYTLGPDFVGRLVGEGGWEAVDAALAEPPQTMAELLDPGLHDDGLTPAPVDPGSAPSGWEAVDSLSWGAFEVLLLMELAESHTPDADVAAAWRGGRLEAWREGDDVAVAAGWTFAEPDAAAAACEVVTDWHATVADSRPVAEDRYAGPHDALAVDCGHDTVRFAVAPEPAVAESTLGR